jgi:hypothetical protein
MKMSYLAVFFGGVCGALIANALMRPLPPTSVLAMTILSDHYYKKFNYYHDLERLYYHDTQHLRKCREGEIQCSTEELQEAIDHVKNSHWHSKGGLPHRYVLGLKDDDDY